LHQVGDLFELNVKLRCQKLICNWMLGLVTAAFGKFKFCSRIHCTCSSIFFCTLALCRMC